MLLRNRNGNVVVGYITVYDTVFAAADDDDEISNIGTIKSNME
jgi:hypothetical protein